MLDNFRADAARLHAATTPGSLFSSVVLAALLLDSGFQAVALYRAARWFRSRGVPLLGPLLCRLGQLLTGAEIAPAADIGPGLKVSHGSGLVVGGSVRIGAGAHLHQGVTLGAARPDKLAAMPALGDRVMVGAGACLLGGIRVGDGAVIGAHALVVHDVPPGATVLAAPGEIRPAG